MPSWRPRRRLLRVASALALVVLAAVALAIGARRGPATLAQRAAAVESRIRCPSCEDVSVADSDAPSAIAARRQIQAMVRAGASEGDIEHSFVARYGPSILLAPPASGLGALIWVLPAVGLVGALAVLGGLFWRRARALGRLRASP